MFKRQIYLFFDLKNWLIAALSPVLLLWIGLNSTSYGFKRIVIIIFSIFFGLLLPINEGFDAFRHQKMVFDLYLNMEFDEFISDSLDILTFQQSTSSIDLYKHIISYWCGAILQMPKTFFFWVSLFYGIFFSYVVLYAFQYLQFKNFIRLGMIPLSFSILFVLNTNFEGIQTVRTWTGMWVLIYFLILFIEKKKKRYYFLMIISPILIHVGYVLMVLPIAFSSIIHSTRLKFYYVTFFFSIIAHIGVEYVSTYIPQTSLFSTKTEVFGVTSDNLNSTYALESKETKSGISNSERTWYKLLQVGGYFMYLKAFMIFMLMYTKIPERNMSGNELKIFVAGISMLIGSNLFSFINAAGNRMEIIGFQILLLSLLLMITRRLKKGQILITSKVDKFLIYTSLVLMIPEILWKISYELAMSSLFLFIMPVVPLFTEYNISILDTIKLVL